METERPKEYKDLADKLRHDIGIALKPFLQDAVKKNGPQYVVAHTAKGLLHVLYDALATYESSYLKIDNPDLAEQLCTEMDKMIEQYFLALSIKNNIQTILDKMFPNEEN